MSYEPTNWQTGDIVTSTKLNKLEQGVANAGGGGVLVCTQDGTGKLNHTWTEIATSWAVLKDQDTYYILTEAAESSGEYFAVFVYIGESENRILLFVADSADGYPTITTV